jgi:hypothetical protein
LIAAKIREKLLVSKRVAHKFDMQRFDLRKLNDAEVKEEYQVKITNRFEALESFDDNVDMNRAWENIRENIEIAAKASLGHYELQQYKPWFDYGCSKLIDRSKQDKLQWLQTPSEVNGDKMDSVRHEASRTFRTKNRECLKNKINELETNSKKKNIRDLCRGLYSSPSMIRVIKANKMRWAGHVARVGDVKGAYTILVGKPEGRSYWEDLGVDGRIALRWILGK